MARRLYLHIGPPKTGTTFLQAAWWQHREELAEQGLLYPGGHPMDQFRACAIVLDKSRVTRRFSEWQLTAADRIEEAVASWTGDALLSSEHYALAVPELVPGVLRRFAALADELHVVVTVRDLARQVSAAWQQAVKTGNEQTFDDFWRPLADDPERLYWRGQALPSLLTRWTEGVDPAHVHLVVHGPPGSPRRLLWDHLCQVTGSDPGILRPVTNLNESLGVVPTEFLRRVNARLPAERDRIGMDRLTKTFIARNILEPAAAQAPMAMPDEAWAWAVKQSEAVVDELRGRRYHVVGNPDDLIPTRLEVPGRTPDSVTDEEIAELGVEVFARVMVELTQDDRLAKREKRARQRRRAAQAQPVEASAPDRLRDRLLRRERQ